MVGEVLVDCWNLQVDCDCISKKVQTCSGMCCQSVTKALGMVMVLEGGETARTTFAEQAALTAEWSLELDAPPKTPEHAHREYLASILTGVVKNSLLRATTWISQFLSGAAWLQVTILYGFQRVAAIGAMHKAVQKAHCTTPHSVQATIKVLHHLSYHLPAKRCQVASYLGRWLENRAFWVGEAYSSRKLPQNLQMTGINGA